MATRPKPSKLDEVNALIKRTDKENPKKEDLAALRKFLDEDSRLVEANNVSHHAINRVIGSYASSSALLKELLERQVKDSQKAMDYETANVFVKMLIDQVILTNIRLNQLEALHVSKLDGSHTSEQGIYWDKRLSSAQRRFMKACETLAKVKKLLSEAELRDQQAKNKRSQATLASANLYKKLSER